MVNTYRKSTQSVKNTRRGIVTTNEGGNAFKVSNMVALRRALILGTGVGSYYLPAETLTKRFITTLYECLKEHKEEVVHMIEEVSSQGLTSQNETSLLALAHAASFGLTPDSAGLVTNGEAQRIRQVALEALETVARTSTHLLHFVDYVSDLRGWGTALRRAIGNWYLHKEPIDLAFQVTKYQQRDGWSHADVLRLVHPHPGDAVYDGLFNYIVNDGDLSKLELDDVYRYLRAVEYAKDDETSKQDVISLIEDFKLPREVLNTKWLSDPDVWAAMLPHMPIHALLRNLGNMTRIGLITNLSDAEKVVLNKLVTPKNGLLHPLDVMKALYTYSAGHGLRSNNTWNPSQPIVNRLNDLFYESFGTITPTGKRLYVAIDVSGSMTHPTELAPNVTLSTVAAVMGMAVARTEAQAAIYGFTTKPYDIGITAQTTLQDAIRLVNQGRVEWTDCAVPVNHARGHRMSVDAFVLYTDSETNGPTSSDVLRHYRTAMGIPDARMVVNAMVANDISMADQKNPLELDLPGVSSDTPKLINAFVRGEL